MTSLGRIYCDANAGLAASDRALEAYRAALACFGNPSSPHCMGRAARARLTEARSIVAQSIGADLSQIIFTSGGTESDALALIGALKAWSRQHATLPHVVTTQIEHPAVSNTLRLLEKQGRVRVTRVSVGSSGVLNTDDIFAALREDTALVSVVAACNETGVLQPISELGAVLRERKILFHTDAVQALGRVPIDVEQWSVDLLSLSGHKISAVGGIGALYVRADVPMLAALVGGGQEGGRRSGTENVAGAASMAAALREQVDLQPIETLRDRLEGALLQRIEGVRVVGQESDRLANTSCIQLAGCDAEGLLMALDIAGIAISAGSACSSGAIEPSPILLGMGMHPTDAKECVRYSLWSHNDEAQIDCVIAQTIDAVRRMRS